MSRIVAGIHRGRRLNMPKGKDVRPTTDRMRERLFSMLMHSRYPDIIDARVADLYAGTGALGLEALSRGAAHTTFVEKARSSVDIVNSNIALLKLEKETKVISGSARTLPKAVAPFDFIFMDPPYRQGHVTPTLESILDSNWLAEDGVIICELATDDDSVFPDALDVIDERTQGQQRIVFLMRKNTEG